MKQARARPGGAPEPRVSVVIKAYNHARFVGRTIESVLAQTFQDFEIAIVDDGSTDGTPDVIARFTDPRIRFEPWPRNRGLSTAMNAVLKMARGGYIAILNSDDYAMPERLEKQVRYLDAHPLAAAVFSQAQFIDDEGDELPELGMFMPPLAFPDFRPATWIRQFFLKGNCLCAPSAMVRRSVYAQAGTYDPRFTNLQDLDVWVRVAGGLGPRDGPQLRSRRAAEGSELHVLPEKLTAFRVRSQAANLSAGRPDSLSRAALEWCRILQRYPEMDERLLRSAFEIDCGLWNIDMGQPKFRWLADLAMKVGLSPHRLFAVWTLFDGARTDADFDRLRDVSGEARVI